MAKKKKGQRRGPSVPPKSGGGPARLGEGGAAKTKAGGAASASDIESENAKAEKESERAESTEPEETDAGETEDAASEEDAPENTTKAAKSATGADETVDPAEIPGPHKHDEKLSRAAWGAPLVKVDRYWTWFESRLLVAVLLSLIFFVASWVALKGMHHAVPAPVEGQKPPGLFKSLGETGTAFRALVGLSVLGAISRPLTKKLSDFARAIITSGAMAIGVLVAPAWRGVGVGYSEHLFNWLQEGSSLTMVGGLRGIAATLTILLALVGASLAAAGGKHINIDVVLRFFKPELRKIVFVLSTLATVTVCLVAAWGFFDYIAITKFGADDGAAPRVRIATAMKEVNRDFFLWRKQFGLDLSAAPHVIGGGKWDDDARMNGRQWNQFIEEGGYRDHYSKEEVDGLLAPEGALDEPRVPMAAVPGASPRGLLVDPLNLIWPIGLFIIGMRFLLRMLLVLSGHASVEPEPDEFEGAKAAGVEVSAIADELAEHGTHGNEPKKASAEDDDGEGEPEAGEPAKGGA